MFDGSLFASGGTTFDCWNNPNTYGGQSATTVAYNGGFISCYFYAKADCKGGPVATSRASTCG